MEFMKNAGITINATSTITMIHVVGLNSMRTAYQTVPVLFQSTRCCKATHR